MQCAMCCRVQVWLFIGVLVILGSGTRWVIPVVASLAFTAVIIIVPAIYEYCLNDAQKAAVTARLSKIPGFRSRQSGDGGAQAHTQLLPSVKDRAALHKADEYDLTDGKDVGANLSKRS